MSLSSLLAEVLFVGHSLVGASLPAMVERAAAAQSVPLRVERQIINGAPLVWNWDHSARAEGIDGRAALESGRFDHLVLTEAIPLANHVEWSSSGDYARAWADHARAANPAAQVWIYETWHSLASGTGQAIEHDARADIPWRERLDRDHGAWRAIAEAAGPDVRLIPAGQAMGRLADEIARGTVPGLSDIREVFADDIHPNDRGFYLVAMVTHAALTGRDPRGLPHRLVRQWASRSTVVTEDMARRMQEIAWEVVREERSRPPAPRQGAVPEVAVTEAPVILADPPDGAGGGGLSAPHRPGAGAIPPEDISFKVKGQDIAALGGVEAPGIGFGLAEVNDWSVQQPFLDVMKTARSWTGHLPGQWGGWGHDELAAGGWLDDEGWPLAIPPDLTGIAALILTDLPEDAGGVAGRYVLTHEGRGVMEVGGRARVVERAEGRVVFDFAPGEGAVSLTITATEPADPIRRIRVVRADRAALLDGGAVFNPDWLARIRGARLIRFMDWMATNDSRLARLEDRPEPRDYTWARLGVPAEIMVALANELGADPWFTIPHLAEDALVRRYAEIARDGLAPGLAAHVEYSNEVWNMQFAQGNWAEEQARARWGGQEWKWVQFYALRAAEVAGIWADVFRDSPGRLVRILSPQTGWKGLEEDILNAPLVMAEGRAAPHTAFDAWAVTGYFTGGIGWAENAGLLQGWLADSRRVAAAEADRLGLTGAARAGHVEAHRFDHALRIAGENMVDGRHSGDIRDTVAGLLTDILPYHAEVAARHGLRLMMYEGGTHAVGHGPQAGDEEVTAFLHRLNYGEGVAAAYRVLIDGWRELTDAPFNAYVDVRAPNRWGSWGALRHLGDDNPRWRALARGE